MSACRSPYLLQRLGVERGGHGAADGALGVLVQGDRALEILTWTKRWLFK